MSVRDNSMAMGPRSWWETPIMNFNRMKWNILSGIGKYSSLMIILVVYVGMKIIVSSMLQQMLRLSSNWDSLQLLTPVTRNTAERMSKTTNDNIGPMMTGIIMLMIMLLTPNTDCNESLEKKRNSWFSTNSQ